MSNASYQRNFIPSFLRTLSILCTVYRVPLTVVDLNLLMAYRRRPGGGTDAGRRPTHAANKKTMASAYRKYLGVLAFVLTHQATHAQRK